MPSPAACSASREKPRAIEPRSPRLAVLIDADNTSPRIAAGLFDEVAKMGEASAVAVEGETEIAITLRPTSAPLISQRPAD